MTGFLLSVLFAAAAAFATGAIVTTWRSHGGQVLALSRELRAMGTMHECRYTITTVGVRPAAAAVYYPDFRAGASSRPMQPVLRAAA